VLVNNQAVTISTVKADAEFSADDTNAPANPISTENSQMNRVLLVISGQAHNTFAGLNYLDCALATDNQWQVNLDGGTYEDLTPNGQMVDQDWYCILQGANASFLFMFDITDLMATNVDGKIGVKLTNAVSKQDSLITTVSIAVQYLWRK
ncbi:MAG: hypothetical protein UY48_C0044G0001, partial [Candidatus Gottesmanbacteria bacterium GW2011_GWB1_49_7]